jgi:hypothetical protein
MNPDKNIRLFIFALAAGLLLVGTTVFLQGQSIMKMQKSLSTIADSIAKQGVKPASEPEKKAPAATERKLLTMADANSRIMSFIAEVEGDWNDKVVPTSMTTEPMMLDNGRTLHVPYDASWGNAKYEIDTFELENGTYHFGPMWISDMTGAFRLGEVRVTNARSLDAALADPTYTSKDCSQIETFIPKKVRIKNVDAVRFEGVECEGEGLGYEVQFGDKNLVFKDYYTREDVLSRWVLERM